VPHTRGVAHLHHPLLQLVRDVHADCSAHLTPLYGSQGVRKKRKNHRPQGAFDWIAVGVLDVHLAEKLVYGFVVHVLDPMGQTQPLPPRGVVELIGRRFS